MRRIIIILVLNGFLIAAHSQIIKGIVYDRSNDSTLASAMVYISGTSVGTYSDIHGNFELDISKFATLPITISLLGYRSITLHEPATDKVLHIYLIPKINELKEIVIKAKEPGDREGYLNAFKRQFLGETLNSMSCEILNENDIFLSYNPDSCTLKAFAYKPILIRNKALGYTITYYLNKFVFFEKTTEKSIVTRNHEQLTSLLLQGNYRFKDEISALSPSEKIKVAARRRSAYLGSRMHFFRTLYAGTLSQKGNHGLILSENMPASFPFSISSNKPIDARKLVLKKDSISAFLGYQGALSVKYRQRLTPITIRVNSLYFERDGYFDPIGIEFSGEMSKQRIGDLLPFEYQDDE
jgi:hypothetical protein